MPFWKTVKDRIWKAWQATVENWLLHHAHLCLIVCSILAVFFLALGLVQARTLESLSARLLSNPTEATPHQFGGLEAFVLDGFAGNVVPSSLPPNVTDISKDIDAVIAEPLPAIKTLKLKSQPEKAESLRQQYISDEDRDVFMFLPAISTASFRPVNKALVNESTVADLGIPKDSLLRNDIAAGLAAKQKLEDLQKASFDKETGQQFTQVYLVSATGVLRDYNNGGSDDNSFISHRSFPERPYFWPTVEGKASEVTCPSPFTFCTRPYVDLGGHGIVVTMCRKIVARTDISDMVLCGDISFPPNKVSQIVAGEIKPFALAQPKQIACSIETNDVHCDSADSDDEAHMVEADLKGAVDGGRSEEMLGGIYKLTQVNSAKDKKEPLIVRAIEDIPYAGKYIRMAFPQEEGTSFSFTLPAGVVRKSGKMDVKFLVCAVDFGRPTVLLVISVIGGTFSVAGLFLAIFYSFQARRKSFEFISSLQDVMSACPTPFVHLNEEGRVIGANNAFRELVGEDSDQLSQTRFFSLLDQPSQARYAVVAKCRRDKLLTRPYEMSILRKGQNSEQVVVSGSALDMPRTSEFKITQPATTFLHTFGIVVPRSLMNDSDFQSLGVLSDSLALPEFEELLTSSAHKPIATEEHAS